MSKRPRITESKIVDDSDAEIVKVEKGHTVFLQFPNDKEEVGVVLSVEHNEEGEIRCLAIYGSAIDMML